MRWVQQAAMTPHRCAVVPYIGNSTTVRGFIDTGMDLPGWDPHVYVSVEAVEQMARMVGWEPRTVAQQQAVKVKGLEAKVAELEQELAEAAEFRRSAEYTLGQFGTQVRKKPGPKKEAVA